MILGAYMYYNYIMYNFYFIIMLYIDMLSIIQHDTSFLSVRYLYK